MSCPNFIPRKKMEPCGELNLWLPFPFKIIDDDLYHNDELFAKYEREEGNETIYKIVSESKYMGKEIRLMIRDKNPY